MSKKLPPSEYRRRMSAIKPFVNFNFKGGTPKTKRIISRYFNELQPLIERGYKPKPVTQKSVKALADIFGDLPARRRLKSFPIPPEVSRVKIKRGQITYERSGIRHSTTTFNRRAFASDTEGYIRRFAQKTNGKLFRIKAGKYFVPGTYDLDDVIHEIEALQQKYSGAPGTRSNWRDWLSIEAVDFGDDDEI